MKKTMWSFTVAALSTAAFVATSAQAGNGLYLGAEEHQHMAMVSAAPEVTVSYRCDAGDEGVLEIDGPLHYCPDAAQIEVTARDTFRINVTTSTVATFSVNDAESASCPSDEVVAWMVKISPSGSSARVEADLYRASQCEPCREEHTLCRDEE